jgi:hypothetical protein
MVVEIFLHFVFLCFHSIMDIYYLKHGEVCMCVIGTKLIFA